MNWLISIALFLLIVVIMIEVFVIYRRVSRCKTLEQVDISDENTDSSLTPIQDPNTQQITTLDDGQPATPVESQHTPPALVDKPDAQIKADILRVINEFTINDVNLEGCLRFARKLEPLFSITLRDKYEPFIRKHMMAHTKAYGYITQARLGYHAMKADKEVERLRKLGQFP